MRKMIFCFALLNSFLELSGQSCQIINENLLRTFDFFEEKLKFKKGGNGFIIAEIVSMSNQSNQQNFDEIEIICSVRYSHAFIANNPSDYFMITTSGSPVFIYTGLEILAPREYSLEEMLIFSKHSHYGGFFVVFENYLLSFKDEQIQMQSTNQQAKSWINEPAKN